MDEHLTAISMISTTLASPDYPAYPIYSIYPITPIQPITPQAIQSIMMSGFMNGAIIGYGLWLIIFGIIIAVGLFKKVIS